MRAACFHWKPPNLEPLWLQEHSLTLTSSPAVLGNLSLVVVARQDGRVVAYDLATGNKRWTYDAEEPTMATPAAADDRIYVASLHHLHILDLSTGQRVAATPLKKNSETVASPAVSRSHVYVSTAHQGSASGIPFGRELLSFSLDLTQRGHDFDGGSGVTSPAIGSDGTLYAVASDAGTSFVRAYPPPGS